MVETMEQNFCKYLNTKYCVAHNSGTSALFNLYYSAGLRRGDEVLVQGYTFYATATPLYFLGCKIVLIDSTVNGNIDINDLKHKITKNTKAVVITHLWGIPAEVAEIAKILKERHILLFEDCSHALGSSVNGKAVGSFGIGSAWSLGAKKNITGGQGGMLTTNDYNIFQKSVCFGFSTNNFGDKKITLDELKTFKVTGIGFNFRMHPFSSFVINEQLKKYSNVLEEKNKIANYFIQEINKINGLEVPYIPLGAKSSWYTLSNAWNYHERVIKMPVYYGKNSLLYAQAYINAIKKVVNNYKDLLKSVK